MPTTLSAGCGSIQVLLPNVPFSSDSQSIATLRGGAASDADTLAKLDAKKPDKAEAETISAVWDFTAAPTLPADTIDAITEIAAALRSGDDATLITGTAGTSGSFASWNADGDAVDALKAVPSGDVVGSSDAQVLTNKTIALGSNTVSGTLAQFNAALSDGSFASLAGMETLTNKTLTAPTINAGALSGTFTGDPTFSGDPVFSGAPDFSGISNADALRTVLDIGETALTVSTIAALKALSSATDGDIIFVSGYAAAGDGGHRYVKYDASSTETENDVTVFEFATLAGRAIHMGPVYPEHAGADTSVDDNSAALQRIADAKIDCEGQGRAYAIEDTVDLAADTTAEWSNFEVKTGPAAAADLIMIKGIGADFAAIGDLTANATHGEDTVTLDSGDSSALSAGDLILIHDDGDWNPQNALNSEMAYVASEASGTVSLRTGLKCSYTTANSAAVLRWASSLAPKFTNFTVRGGGGSTTHTGLKLTFAGPGTRIEGFRAYDTRRRGLWFVNQVGAVVRDGAAYDCDESGFGYGCAVTGGFGGHFGDWSGKSVRHMTTVGSGSSGVSANCPDLVVLRNYSFGDVHCVDAKGEIVDSHGGAVDGVYGNITGSMDATATTPAIIFQGARMITGNINIAGNGGTGLVIQTYGCGDGDRPNFFTFGHVVIDSDVEDTETNDSWVGNWSNEGATGERLELIQCASIRGNGNIGIRVAPDNGDIGRVDLGTGGRLEATEADALRVTDTASYRVERVLARAMEFVSNSASGWVPYRQNTTNSGAFYPTISSFVDCHFNNTVADIAVRADGGLVQLTRCTTSEGTNGDTFSDDGDFQIDGIGWQAKTIASGAVSDVLPGAVIELTSESGTTDALASLSVTTSIYDHNGVFDAGQLEQAVITARLTAADGHTITLTHGTSEGAIYCPWGEDIEVTDRRSVLVALLPAQSGGRTAQWHVLSDPAPDLIRPTTVDLQSGGVVKVNGTQVVGARVVDADLADTAAITAQSLTDNSGGTASDTIAAIGGTYSQSEVANAVASLADEINKLKADNDAQKTALDAAVSCIRTHGLGATS